MAVVDLKCHYCMYLDNNGSVQDEFKLGICLFYKASGF